MTAGDVWGAAERAGARGQAGEAQCGRPSPALAASAARRLSPHGAAAAAAEAAAESAAAAEADTVRSAGRAVELSIPAGPDAEAGPTSGSTSVSFDLRITSESAGHSRLESCQNHSKLELSESLKT